MKLEIGKRWLNILAVIATLFVNGLANSLPINGLTTGEISDRFEVFFVPAAYVFSIWGLIYLGLIAFAIYQVWPGQLQNSRLKRIGYLFALSSAANIAWIFLWHYEVFPLTIVAMIVLLITLIAIYLRLDIGRASVSRIEKLTVDIPFSIYLGWITVATIANMTSLLDYLGWNGWGISSEIWTLIMLIAASAIASVVSFTRGDVAYMLVLVWAFIGIAVKFPGTPLVSISAWSAAGYVAVVMIAGAIFNQQQMRRLVRI